MNDKNLINELKLSSRVLGFTSNSGRLIHANQRLEDEEITQLKYLARNQHAQFSLKKALSVLSQHEQSLEVVSDLKATMSDTTLDAKTRASAAGMLTYQNPVEAEKVLISQLTTESPQVLRQTIKALGQVGGDQAYEALQRVKTRHNNHTSRQLAFAKSLIAHRLGLRSDSLGTPLFKGNGDNSVRDLKDLGAKFSVVEGEVPELTRNLALELKPKYQFELESCGRQWCFFENEALAQNPESVNDRKYVVGLIGLYNPTFKRYEPHYYVLTDPKGSRINMHLVTMNGQVQYSGESHWRGSGLEFELFDTFDGREIFTFLSGNLGKDFQLSVRQSPK